MDLTIIASAAINGLLLGGIYTLVACGLTVLRFDLRGMGFGSLESVHLCPK